MGKDAIVVCTQYSGSPSLAPRGDCIVVVGRGELENMREELQYPGYVVAWDQPHTAEAVHNWHL